MKNFTKKAKLLIVITVLFILKASNSLAQSGSPPSPLKIIKKSIEVSGDLNDDSLQISLQIICAQGKNRGQSYNPLPPYNPFRIVTEFQIDKLNGKEIVHAKNPFNGFIFEDTTKTI